MKHNLSAISASWGEQVFFHLERSFQVCEQAYSKEQHLKMIAATLLTCLCPISLLFVIQQGRSSGCYRGQVHGREEARCSGAVWQGRGHNTFHRELAPAQQDGRKINVTETWHNALESLPPLPL